MVVLMSADEQRVLSKLTKVPDINPELVEISCMAVCLNHTR